MYDPEVSKQFAKEVLKNTKYEDTFEDKTFMDHETEGFDGWSYV